MPNLFDANNELITFLSAISKLKEVGSQAVPVDELAKRAGVKVPELLAGGNIRPAKTSDKPPVANSFTISSTKSPLASLLTFLAKTKCWLVCIDHDEHIHCVHICITCFDSWPGPGCHIHGSWD